MVVPARYRSTRLPGKPLVSLHGKPLICRVVERCVSVPGVQEVIVATDDERIAAAMGSSPAAASVRTVMTPSALASGTDRVALVAAELDVEVIVNVQGDEAFLDAVGLGRAIDAFRADDVEIGTLRAPLVDATDLDEPSVVKVVVDAAGRALYFSRAPIPFQRGGAGTADDPVEGAWVHVGVYLYRPEALRRWAERPPSTLERIEGLEQLRALEAGETIQTYEVAQTLPGIDTPEDLERARRLLATS